MHNYYLVNFKNMSTLLNIVDSLLLKKEHFESLERNTLSFSENVYAY